MLHVDPKMLTRLVELETDLIDRLERADTEGWLGEIEGINLSLSFLRDKRSRAQRLTTRADLGLPTHRRPESSDIRRNTAAPDEQHA